MGLGCRALQCSPGPENASGVSRVQVNPHSKEKLLFPGSWSRNCSIRVGERVLTLALNNPQAWGWRIDPLAVLPHPWLELLTVFIISRFVILFQNGNRTPWGNVFPGDYCLQLFAL